MGPALATSLVVSNIIGIGIFTTLGLLARSLPDPGILLGIWVIGGLLALAGALCYAELGALFPRAGGEYAFLREAYGPLTAFLSGWGSLFAGFSAAIAAAAVGFTEYLSYYFPALAIHSRSAGSHWGIGPGHLVATAVIVLFSSLHYRKVQLGGPIHIGLTSFKVGVILVFVVAGFVLGRGDGARFMPAVPPSDWPRFVPAAGAGLIYVMFSYSGWNASSYIGSEIRNPQRNLPRSLIFGTLVVVALYISLNALYIYSVPLKDMSNVIRIAELASLNLFGVNVAPFVNVVIMGTILGSISAMIIAGPRVYYAIARDGLFPQAIARVHPRFGTPGNAILLQAAWSILLLFSGRFEQLLTFSGVVLILFSVLTVGAVFVIRHRRRGKPLPYASLGYPWTPMLFLAISVWVIVASFHDQPKESLCGLAVVAGGIPFYYIWNWRRK